MADVTEMDYEHVAALGRGYLIGFEEYTVRQRPSWIRLITGFRASRRRPSWLSPRALGGT